ncbi:MAG: DNA mismatch repair protein MutS, partial [Chloroflexi bacterium]|nr:DNA mismatch repair protein MutS [Chloroflexota bacterium]
GADRSYGVHVGRLAGLPPAVIARAWDLLAELESNGRLDSGSVGASAAVQLSLMSMMAGPSAVEAELLDIDIANLTPLQAINELYRLQALSGDDEGASS